MSYFNMHPKSGSSLRKRRLDVVEALDNSGIKYVEKDGLIYADKYSYDPKTGMVLDLETGARARGVNNLIRKVRGDFGY